jgi:hypothetical protein
MRIADANGDVWNVLAQRWDGEKFVIQPERVMIDDHWWLINYITRNTLVDILYPFKMNDTFSSIVSISYGTVFPPEDPIPA